LECFKKRGINEMEKITKVNRIKNRLESNKDMKNKIIVVNPKRIKINL
jgi:hypothetical protein